MSNNSRSNVDLKAVLQGQKSFDTVGDVLVRQIEDEAILLHLPTGTYLSLSETSIPFWEALQNKQPLEPVVEQIINEYDVEYSQVVKDLQTFVEDLLKFKVIRQSSDAS